MAAPEIEKTCDTCRYCDLGKDDEPCWECRDRDDWYLWESVTPAAPAPVADEALKYDAGKPRYDLLPPEALDGLARLYGLGATKYDARNWEKGMDWSRVFAALQRHVWSWFRGEDHCPADGQHHLLSVMWCAMALYAYQHRGIGTDDRPRSGGEKPGFWRKETAHA